MKKFFAALLLLIPLLTLSSVDAQFNKCGPGFCNPVANIPSCSQSVAFFARTTNLNSSYTQPYQSLICGLVADGVWSKFDLFYVFATQDTTNAALNLVSSAYPASINGSPAFSANNGFTGVEGSFTVFINTSFTPGSGSGYQYTQDSAHMSVYGNTNVQSSNLAVGMSTGTNSWQTGVLPRYTDDNFYCRVNSTTTLPAGSPNTNSIGHYSCNRDTSTTMQNYKNGVVQLSPTNTSGTMITNPMVTLGYNSAGTVVGSRDQISMVTIGASLTATNTLNLYQRSCKFLTDIGNPNGC